MLPATSPKPKPRKRAMWSSKRTSMNISEKTSQADQSEDISGFTNLLKPKQLRSGKLVDRNLGNAAGYSMSKLKKQ